MCLCSCALPYALLLQQLVFYLPQKSVLLSGNDSLEVFVEGEISASLPNSFMFSSHFQDGVLGCDKYS